MEGSCRNREIGKEGDFWKLLLYLPDKLLIEIRSIIDEIPDGAGKAIGRKAKMGLGTTYLQRRS